MSNRTKKVYIIGSFPSSLFRAFDKEEYANDFIEHGILFMRQLGYYQKHEDLNRKDQGEGEGKLVYQTYRPVLTFDQKTKGILSRTFEYGPVNFGTSSVNDRYILCFSGPHVDIKHLAHQYGQYIIRIFHPEMLVHDIANFLEQNEHLSEVMWLDCVQVKYDKGNVVNQIPEPASQDRVRMSYSQKEPRFSVDCEYRLVLELPITVDSPPKEIRVDLQKRLEYAELIRL